MFERTSSGQNIQPNLKRRSCLELRNLRVVDLSQRLLAACFALSKQPDSGFVVTPVAAAELIVSQRLQGHGEEDFDQSSASDGSLPMSFILHPWQLLLVILAGWISRSSKK